MAFWHLKISPDAADNPDESEGTIEEQAEAAKQKMRATTVELGATILRLAEVADDA